MGLLKNIVLKFEEKIKSRKIWFRILEQSFLTLSVELPTDIGLIGKLLAWRSAEKGQKLEKLTLKPIINITKKIKTLMMVK